MRRQGWLARGFALGVVIAMSAGCGGDSATGPRQDRLEAVSPTNMTATVGSAVPASPVVVLKDGSGAPLPGIVVSFRLYGVAARGMGSVTNTVATTDSDGRASAGEWILAGKVGINLLVASTLGLPWVSFTATGEAGAPAIVQSVDDIDRGGVAGASGGTLAARVYDRFFNALPDIAVQFTVESGGGFIASATPRTDRYGLAISGIWTLGAAGPNTAVAVVSDSFTARYTALARTGGAVVATYELVTLNGHPLPLGNLTGASYVLMDNGTFTMVRTYVDGAGRASVVARAGTYTGSTSELTLRYQTTTDYGTLSGNTLTFYYDGWDDGWIEVFEKLKD